MTFDPILKAATAHAESVTDSRTGINPLLWISALVSPLVFDDGSGDDIDLKVFVESLDPGAKMFTLDGHVCFLTSDLSVQEVSDRFRKMAGSALFLVTDITKADCAGRMPGFFWEDLKQTKLPAAAE